MSKICPLVQRKVLYTECLECDEKACKAALMQSLENKENINHAEYREDTVNGTGRSNRMDPDNI